MRRGGRLVPENLFDLFHDLVGDLGQQLQGFDVVVDLARLGRTQDHGADIRVLHAPGQGQLCNGAAQLLSNLGELADLSNLGFAFFLLQRADGTRKEIAVRSEARVFGDAIIVFAREQARGEWRPDGGAVLELLEQWGIFYFEAFTMEC